MAGTKIEFDISYSDNGEKIITMKDPSNLNLDVQKKDSYSIMGTT